MAYLAGQKEAGADGAVSKTSFFGKRDPNFHRNMVGWPVSVLGCTAGIIFGKYVLALSGDQLMITLAISLAVSAGKYAEAYHNSIVNGSPLLSFALGAFLTSLFASVVACVIVRYVHL